MFTDCTLACLGCVWIDASDGVVTTLVQQRDDECFEQFIKRQHAFVRSHKRVSDEECPYAID